jgi:hypothetical protein
MYTKTSGSEYCPLSKKERNMLRIFARRTLRMIYFPIKDTDIWRTRYNSELYRLFDKLEVVKMIKIGILKWLIHDFRVQEQVLTKAFSS